MSDTAQLGLGGALAALPAQLGSPGVIAGIAVLVATLWLLAKRAQADDWASLPGPPPSNWLLGHLPQINVPNVHRFFQDNCQKYAKDGLFKCRMLNLKVVVVSNPILVQALVDRRNDLPKSPEIYDSVDELFSPKGLRSFFNTHNYDEWKLVRKATAPAFSPAEIRKAFPLLLKVTNEISDAVASQVAAGNGEIDVTEMAMRVTLDVIGCTGYGYDFKARTYAPCEMFEIVPPLLGEFTLRGTNPLRRVLHTLLPFLPEARLYNQRVKLCWKWWRVLLKSVRATDLVAAEAAGDNSLRTCLARLPMDDDLLLPQLGAYLIAGFETTAHSIAWSLYELAANPEVQAKVAAELAAAGLLGPSRRPLEYSDLSELRYLNMVLKESMRLHPVASTGTVRKADRMVELGGYRLAPRTILWVPLVAMLTSQHNWERAEEFWPERWEAEGQPPAGGTSGPTRLGHSSLPSKTYLPFSDGPRDCIGQSLAMVEARAVLASIVGRFQLEVAPRMGSRADVRAKEVMKLTLQLKDGTHLRLSERQ